MRTPSQVVRLCAIVIPLMHLAIFVSLFSRMTPLRERLFGKRFSQPIFFLMTCTSS